MNKMEPSGLDIDSHFQKKEVNDTVFELVAEDTKPAV
jgi:hypothetical protein